MTKLTKDDIDNFWIRCYLHTSKDFLEASIDRAYRDFNRTLHGIRKNQSKQSYQELKAVMIKIANDLSYKQFQNQEQFDDWHEHNCNKLKEEFKNRTNHHINIGQTQKWINMTLKYLFALGDRITGISTNYKYFHIPVDNIILNKLKSAGVNKFKKSWSRVDNYKEYLDFQIKVRQRYKDEIPMDVEFKLYNE